MWTGHNRAANTRQGQYSANFSTTVESSEITGCVPRDVNEQLATEFVEVIQQRQRLRKARHKPVQPRPQLHPLISTDTRVDDTGPVLFTLAITRAELKV